MTIKQKRALNPKTLARVRAIIIGLEDHLERMTTGNLAHERNCALGMLDGLKHWADEATGHKAEGPARSEQ